MIYNIYLLIPLLLVAYKVLKIVQLRIRSNSNGNKPIASFISDGRFGFKTVREMVQRREAGTLIDYFHKRFEDNRSNTLSARIAGMITINTRDPENIKAILGTQFNDFDLGVRHSQFYALLGDGIFTLDGDGWKHSRAMLRPQFSREQVAHVKSLEPHIKILIESIKNYQGEMFDIQDYFFKFTIDTATEFLFGESCSSLSEGMSEKGGISIEMKQKFPKAFNDSQSTLADRTMLQRFYFLNNPQSFKDNCKIVHEFTDFFVNKALNAPSKELDEKSEYGYTFLYELVKQTRDPKVLRDQALNILLAGRDTTAGLLSFTFFELARNPGVFKKLKEEVYSRFGSGKDVKIDEITFESLKRCEYLKAVINEILRLYPSVPVNFRVSNKNTSLPRGGGPDEQSSVYIEKGTVVSYCISSCQRNKAIYGQDADIFRPERWFEESTKKLGWAYLPFNGGPRICLGQQFALIEASYVITRLVQEFEHLSGIGEFPPKKSSQLTMCLKDGAYVSMY
ncbi:cytochrome P450 52A12 [[Candida] jaroonii]|uniref:Cytochrome P450 52A12 n=1 Tax=[Candida] jaroonii TaxID=467808 RepID=A0ACA9Y160_9ASCO|nr:cytochrome P450 52A12 [[Candida] jaroonii]